MVNTYIDTSKQFFKDKCAEHNLKITPQRVIIYEELSKSKDHPSADAIYKRVRKTLPNIHKFLDNYFKLRKIAKTVDDLAEFFNQATSL